MTIARIIQWLLSLADNLVLWGRERQLISAGEDKAIAEMYRRSHEVHAAAVAARDAVERDLRDHPERVRDLDPDSRT